MSRKVIIGSDHGGFALKNVLVPWLADRGYDVVDVGPDNTKSVDYPNYAKMVVDQIEGDALGVLICGTGLGMSMTANKFPGIRAAVCTGEYMARMARAHNNANVLCLGERVIGPGVGVDVLNAFLTTDFEGDRHLRRINLMEELPKQG